MIGFSSLALAGRAPTLAELYEDDFLIGTALAGGFDHGDSLGNSRSERSIICREFNVLTAENCMKPLYMRPSAGEFNFAGSDAFIEYALKNNMEVVGHTLVWHHQTPSWFFCDAQGNELGRKALIERMRHHIHTIVGRYKGKVRFWDVVNEAVVVESIPKEERMANAFGKVAPQYAFLRKSKWLEIIGEEYIELAYRFAHEADPDALLLYNDYSLTDPLKVLFTANMVRDLKARGVPIHGVGMQAHWHTEHPSLDEISNAIETLSAVGVQVSLTELDMSVLPVAQKHVGADLSDLLGYEDQLNPFVEGIPMDVLQLQADRFREIFNLLLEYRDVVERVTFWGVADGHSWKNHYPIRGRTDYPLIYDRNYQPKPAYEAIHAIKAN
ncbi:MAG: endo-1,4-beta-xylanase [Coraliomargaritaceae bacterium]